MTPIQTKHTLKMYNKTKSSKLPSLFLCHLIEWHEITSQLKINRDSVQPTKKTTAHTIENKKLSLSTNQDSIWMLDPTKVDNTELKWASRNFLFFPRLWRSDVFSPRLKFSHEATLIKKQTKKKLQTRDITSKNWVRFNTYCVRKIPLSFYKHRTRAPWSKPAWNRYRKWMDVWLLDWDAFQNLSGTFCKGGFLWWGPGCFLFSDESSPVHGEAKHRDQG